MQRLPLSVWAAWSLVLIVLFGCTPAAPPAFEPAAASGAEVAAPVAPTASPLPQPTQTTSEVGNEAGAELQLASFVDPAALLPTAVQPIPVATILPTAVPPQPCSVAPNVDANIQELVNNVSGQNLVTSVTTLEGFGSRHTLSSTTSPTVGIGAARTWIYNEFDRVGNGRLQVSFDEFPVLFGGLTTNQQNVVAVLPGESTHAGVVVLMAHYDSRSIDMADGFSLAPGANDNATGVSVLIETARLLSTQTWNQTVMFVAFAAEEQGTQGSHHFVQEQLSKGMVFDAALNNDMVGGRPGIPQNVRLFSAGPDTSLNRQLARYIDVIAQLYLPNFDVVLQDAIDREGRYGDHREFTNAGIASARLIESQEDPSVQHSSLDTFDRIDYSYLFQVTQLNVAAVANMIGAPAAPATPVVTPLDNTGRYEVAWQPDADSPAAAGYAISFRPVGSAEFAPLHTACANQVNTAVFSGLDPETTYAVSVAALDGGGNIGLFSPETIVTCPCQ
jgi:hypothetical protein